MARHDMKAWCKKNLNDIKWKNTVESCLTCKRKWNDMTSKEKNEWVTEWLSESLHE